MDALVLVMTRGMSLAAWRHSGVLEREWALYEAMRERYDRLLVVSWGERSDDASIARGLGAELVAPEAGEDPGAWEGRAPLAAGAALAGVSRIVVRNNQFEGGRLAVAVADRSRDGGSTVALLARGGYLWSRFAADRSGPASLEAARAAAEEAQLVQAADAVIGTTAAMLDDLAWRHALPFERLHLVPNYVVPGPEPDRERGLILVAGQLIERKRVDLVLRAVGALPRPLRESTRIEIVGHGPDLDRLEALAAEFAINATFCGQLGHRELRERMSRCAIFAQASRLEGHPKTVLEAMAGGAAVIVADAPGLRETVTHGRTGLVVPAEVAAFSEAMARVLTDPGLRSGLGAAARDWTREHVSLERILALECEAHDAALESAAERTGAPAPAPAEVTFPPALLSAPHETQVAAFARCVGGFAKRLAPHDRARFLLALDTPLYIEQGAAAIAADGGLHPKHRLMRYHDFFCERIARGQRVLDLGCGVGALAASIAARCEARTTGMDLNEQNLAAAEQRAAEAGVDHLARFCLGDITRDRAEGEFDIIVLSNVLEHLREREQLLRTWIDWYHPRRLLIRVPNFERDWRVPFKRELGVEWRLDDTHETEHTPEQLEIEIREAGLTIDEMHPRWGELWVNARPT